ncbi:MAG: pentapeptide repeat-containing protein, partial [Candidatus Brocadia sp.]
MADQGIIMPKCAYKGERIKEIEEGWIEKYVQDDKEKKEKKVMLQSLLADMGEDANCTREAVAGSEFCMFHDENYWKEHEEEVRNEFLKLLKSNGEKYFIGFHLPRITFLDRIEGDLHMELTKIHGNFVITSIIEFEFNGAVFFDMAAFQGAAWFEKATFKGEASFDGTTFQGITLFEKTVFEREVSFNGTTFQGITLFEKATFKGKVSFWAATFENEVSF